MSGKQSLFVMVFVAFLIILEHKEKGVLAVLAILGVGILFCLAAYLLGFLVLLILTRDIKETWKELNPKELIKAVK